MTFITTNAKIKPIKISRMWFIPASLPPRLLLHIRSPARPTPRHGFLDTFAHSHFYIQAASPQRSFSPAVDSSLRCSGRLSAHLKDRASTQFYDDRNFGMNHNSYFTPASLPQRNPSRTRLTRHKAASNSREALPSRCTAFRACPFGWTAPSILRAESTNDRAVRSRSA